MFLNTKKIMLILNLRVTTEYYTVPAVNLRRNLWVPLMEQFPNKVALIATNRTR